MFKKVHAIVSRSNITIEQYKTNVPIQREPFVMPGKVTCLDSTRKFEEAIIQTFKRENQKLGGDEGDIVPVELPRFVVRKQGYFVCDRNCLRYPNDCSGIPIKEHEYMNDELSADELYEKYTKKKAEAEEAAKPKARKSDEREEAPVSA